MDNQSQNASIVNRKSSAKENVEYIDPIVLSENTKTKVVLRGWYIRHSNHTEFKAKIESLAKPELGWIEVPEKTINLSG